MTDAIVAERLTKTYRTTRAVSDLQIQVGAGQVFGFLGPNGAGKSTTIRMLMGLQRPTSGRAMVLGLDPNTAGVEIHRRVGYLPGDLALYPRMTGRQHVDWFARARGMGRTPLAETLLERFDVVADRPTRELSKGNRQKIGLVLAFMHRPELLILDEPTTGLDPLMQKQFEHLVRDTVEEGRTVFLSSHELDEVQRVADQVAIIRAGRLVTSDTVEHLRRAAPTKIDSRFADAVQPARFETLDGVRVIAWDGDRLSLEVTGPIGPVLRTIADCDPIDVTSRRPDLDELFMDFYRPAVEVPGAG